MSKTSYISTATAQGAPKMFKILEVLSTIKTSAIKGEDLRPYQKSEKLLQLLWSTSPLQVPDRFY